MASVGGGVETWAVKTLERKFATTMMPKTLVTAMRTDVVNFIRPST